LLGAPGLPRLRPARRGAEHRRMHFLRCRTPVPGRRRPRHAVAEPGLLGRPRNRVGRRRRGRRIDRGDGVRGQRVGLWERCGQSHPGPPMWCALAPSRATAIYPPRRVRWRADGRGDPYPRGRNGKGGGTGAGRLRPTAVAHFRRKPRPHPVPRSPSPIPSPPAPASSLRSSCCRARRTCWRPVPRRRAAPARHRRWRTTPAATSAATTPAARWSAWAR